MNTKFRLRMTRKREATLELLYDELEPYVRLFACLLFIYGVLQLCRVIGMHSHMLDWMERADMAVTGLSFGVLLLDSVVILFTDRYKKWISGPSQESK